MIYYPVPIIRISHHTTKDWTKNTLEVLITVDKVFCVRYHVSCVGSRSLLPRVWCRLRCVSWLAEWQRCNVGYTEDARLPIDCRLRGAGKVSSSSSSLSPVSCPAVPGHDTDQGDRDCSPVSLCVRTGVPRVLGLQFRLQTRVTHETTTECVTHETTIECVTHETMTEGVTHETTT